MTVVRNVILWISLLLLLLMLSVLASIPISIYEKPKDLVKPNPSANYVITNIGVFDVKSGLVKGGKTLVISDGIIEAVIDSNDTENNQHWDETYIHLDGDQKYVVPGLIDMHVHIHDRKYLSAFLSKGVTTVRSMRGLPMQLRWSKEIEQNKWLGSRLVTSSPVLAGLENSHILQQVVSHPYEARRLVRKYFNDGYDLIKVYSYLDALTYTAIIDEASKVGIPVAKHGPETAGDLPISSLEGLQSVEHVENIFNYIMSQEENEAVLNDWIEKFRAIKTPIVPTLATFDHLTRISVEKEAFLSNFSLENLNPVYRFINSEFEVNRWLSSSKAVSTSNVHSLNSLLRITRKLNEAGISLLVGSDTGVLYLGPGESTHQEIFQMQKAGVPAPDIIKAATINAARALGKEDKLGAIEEGKVADLLILTSDPIEDLSALSKPEYMFFKGRLLDGETLKRLDYTSRKPSNWYVSMGRLLEDLLVRFLDINRWM